jgi:hypothetical protein
MATVVGPTQVKGPTAGPFLERRAYSLLGSGDVTGLSWQFDDMLAGSNTTVPVGWIAALTGTGVDIFSAINDEGSGVSQQSTGATAAGQSTHQTRSPIFRAVGTAAGYFCYRLKVTSAITAQTKAYGGVINVAGNKTIAAGVFGANSTTNFVFQYDGVETGTFVSTGVAIDTAYHVYELWFTGDGKLHGAIDFGPDLINATMASAPTDTCTPLRTVANGTDNVARIMRTDYFGSFAART